MDKGSLLNDRKKEYQEGRKNLIIENTGKYDRFSFPSWVSKFCLMIEAKIITLCDLVLNA